MIMDLPKIRRRGRPTRKEMEAAQTAADLAETITVLNQPHRRGDRSQLVESNLGTFIKTFVGPMHKNPDDYSQCVYDCAMSYQKLTFRLWRHTGVPSPYSIELDAPKEIMDDEELAEAVQRWKGDLKDRDSLLKAAGLTAFLAAKELILFDTMPVKLLLCGDVRCVLQSLSNEAAMNL